MPNALSERMHEAFIAQLHLKRIRPSRQTALAGARSRSCARRLGPIPHPSAAIQFEPTLQNIKCPLLPKLLPNTAVQSGKETEEERSEREKG
jgi:hypothetical protein